MTSDVFTEQEELLARLGSDAEAVKIRTQLQSGSLFSDMRSFKAANPEGDMRDFVRWYSPKDVCVETGELSVRMRDTSNAWHQLWQNADACVEWKQVIPSFPICLLFFLFCLVPVVCV
jgi:Rab3 GTPase-activating protein catalytic subunit